MNAFDIYGRIFEDNDLQADQSIKCLYYKNLREWRKTSAWFKGVQGMPIQALWKRQLEDSIFGDSYFALYRINRPTVVVYSWPSGEQRWFLITESQRLIEPENHKVWDKYFPFFNKEAGGLSFGQLEGLMPDRSEEKLVWFPNHKNFTHFLIDSYAPLMHLQALAGSNQLDGYRIPILGGIPGWQAEYMSTCTVKATAITTNIRNHSVCVVRPRSVLLPVFSAKHLAYSFLRTFLKSSFAVETDRAGQGNGKIVLLSRTDHRRIRIRNMSAIEELVRSHNGEVADPVKMTIRDRFNFMKSCSLCISEGSGATNAILFTDQKCNILHLIDPPVTIESEFLVGGWPYLVDRSDRSSFLLGIEAQKLAGSPLGSAYYSESSIAKAISEREMQGLLSK